MQSVFDNILFTEKIYLRELYSFIAEEIDRNASRGQIVRHLKSDGLPLAEADELYLQIFNNLEKTKALVNALRTEIVWREAAAVESILKRMEPQTVMPAVYRQRNDLEKWAFVFMKDELPKVGFHLLLKLFGI